MHKSLSLFLSHTSLKKCIPTTSHSLPILLFSHCRPFSCLYPWIADVLMRLSHGGRSVSLCPHSSTSPSRVCACLPKCPSVCVWSKAYVCVLGGRLAGAFNSALITTDIASPILDPLVKWFPNSAMKLRLIGWRREARSPNPAATCYCRTKW